MKPSAYRGPALLPSLRAGSDHRPAGRRARDQRPDPAVRPVVSALARQLNGEFANEQVDIP
jgi:hypothetical protein